MNIDDGMQGYKENWVWEVCPGRKRTNLFRCPPVASKCKNVAGTENPYQKPIPLVWDWIHRFTTRGDLIVDLTAGSGTVAAAAAVGTKKFPGRSGTMYEVPIVTHSECVSPTMLHYPAPTSRQTV